MVHFTLYSFLYIYVYDNNQTHIVLHLQLLFSMFLTGAAVVTEAAETCTTGLAVLGTVTFLVSFLAGAAVGAVAAVAIHFLQCRLKKRTHTRVKEASNPVYQASGSIYEYISHVEKDREIVTENNQCYVTKDIPELPKPRVSQSSIHDQ